MIHLAGIRENWQCGLLPVSLNGSALHSLLKVDKASALEIAVWCNCSSIFYWQSFLVFMIYPFVFPLLMLLLWKWLHMQQLIIKFHGDWKILWGYSGAYGGLGEQNHVMTPRITLFYIWPLIHSLTSTVFSHLVAAFAFPVLPLTPLLPTAAFHSNTLQVVVAPQRSLSSLSTQNYV